MNSLLGLIIDTGRVRNFERGKREGDRLPPDIPAKIASVGTRFEGLINTECPGKFVIGSAGSASVSQTLALHGPAETINFV
jgi:hypothetical protein